MPYDYSNKRIVALDKTAIANLAKDFAKLVIQYFDPIEIILYGSHAKGTANEESDIDIAYVYASAKTKKELFRFDVTAKDCISTWTQN